MEIDPDILDWKIRKGDKWWQIYTTERVINKLSEAEIPLNQVATIKDARWRIGAPDQTYNHWRGEYK